jgi:predicted enzyme related to lactoylglutathione lyase
VTVRRSPAGGAPTWIDLTTSDVNRGRQFYGAVFGWTFDSPGPDYGGYLNAYKDGKLVAGMMQKDPQWNVPDSWTTYFHTPDVKATLAKATAAGGTSYTDALEVPEKGWMAMLTDPAGAVFGLWQPTGHLGFEVVDEAAAPVWHQLTSRDYAKALDFYREVFGWQTQTEADNPEFRYTTAVFDGQPLLGLMDGASFLPDGVPSNWVFFLGAEDVDKTIGLIVDNGGSVIRPAEDTPYGRLAAVADPTGAGFNLSSLRD